MSEWETSNGADQWGGGGETNGFASGDARNHENGDNAPKGGAADGACRKSVSPITVHAKFLLTLSIAVVKKVTFRASVPSLEKAVEQVALASTVVKKGHKAMDCKEKRAFDWTNVEEKSAEEGWKSLHKADAERDLDDLREAIKVYVKAVPDTTWDQLEKGFRANKFNTYIIASEKETLDTWTIIDLQGNLDRTYTVGFYFSPICQRKALKEAWPTSAEDNVERLTNAGIPMDRGVPKCNRCEQSEIAPKSQERLNVPRSIALFVMRMATVLATVKRSATTLSPARTARSEDIPKTIVRSHAQPKELNAGSVTKPVISHETAQLIPALVATAGEGHVAKDCVEPKNMANVTCRNCEETGHFSKECPKPRDYSKVECNNCKQKGHTSVRCKEPKLEDADGGAGGGGDDPFSSGGPSGGFGNGGDKGGWGGGGEATGDNKDTNGGGGAAATDEW
ncbi:hypothetical protein MMC25_001347 [Agyrium rufum]|nr:hypothetical protein [Agyrium rufum]